MSLRPLVVALSIVAAASVVHTSDGWFVRVTLTPTATARARSQPPGSVVHEIVNGRWFTDTDTTFPPLMIGDGSYDEQTASQLAADLRAS